MVKGKSKDGVDDTRTDWKDPAELKAFCDFCAAQVIAGERSGGFLTPKLVKVVINQLAEMGKVVTHVQVKNKWDHLKKHWKIWKDLLHNETRLGIDSIAGKILATDEWWDRKCQACKGTSTIRRNGLKHVGLLEIMFEGTAATGKHAFAPSQIPRACTPPETPNACTEGSGDSDGSKEFVDPQCEAPMDGIPMSVDCPSVSRSAPTVNKGKGLARNVQLFKGVTKRRHKPRSQLQEMGQNLKALTDVIIESKSASTRTPPANTVATEVQQVLEIVLSLPGVEKGDRLYLFSACYFMNNSEAIVMSLALSRNKVTQLKWLEKQYDMNSDLWC